MESKIDIYNDFASYPIFNHASGFQDIIAALASVVKPEGPGLAKLRQPSAQGNHPGEVRWQAAR